MRPLLACAAAAAAVAAVASQAAHARPDAPLRPFIEHQVELSALSWPADGTVTDGFGPRWGRMHLGIDIGILRSLDVVAAEAGRVESIGYLEGFEGYGNVVLLDHGGGTETMYAHLADVAVRVGEWVAGGERLGTAGCTGSCTGTHLHFELYRHGRPVDPARLLAGAAPL